MTDPVQQLVPFLNAADAGVAVLLLLGAALGWRRGLSGELARLAGVVAAVVAALTACRPLAAWLEASTRLQGGNAETVAYIAVAIGVLALALVVRLLLGALMKVVFAEAIDKKLGAVAGLLHAAVSAVLIFTALNLVPSEGMNRFFGEDSLVGRQVRKVVPILRDRWERHEDWVPAAVEIQDP